MYTSNRSRAFSSFSTRLPQHIHLMGRQRCTQRLTVNILWKLQIFYTSIFCIFFNTIHSAFMWKCHVKSLIWTSLRLNKAIFYEAFIAYLHDFKFFFDKLSFGEISWFLQPNHEYIPNAKFVSNGFASFLRSNSTFYQTKSMEL